jgi:hypothetical protein
MDSTDRSFEWTARVVGALFITATVVDVVGTAVLSPVLSTPVDLIKVHANQGQITLGGLLQLIAAFASAGIAIGLYPVLRRHHEGLALGAVAFRTMEAVLYIVGVVCLVSLLTLGQDYVTAGFAGAAALPSAGTLTMAARDATGVLAVIAFCLGALMYYAIFFQTRLIPRWLSAWGLLGAALALVGALLVMLRVTTLLSTTQVLLSALIGVQELALAVWLLLRGFDTAAIASRPGPASGS